MRLQRDHHVPAQVYRSGGVRLSGTYRLVLTRHRLADRERPCVEVHIRPLQGEQLSEAESRFNEEMEDGEELLRSQERAGLFRVQRLHLLTVLAALAAEAQGLLKPATGFVVSRPNSTASPHGRRTWTRTPSAVRTSQRPGSSSRRPRRSPPEAGTDPSWGSPARNLKIPCGVSETEASPHG
jgi:hypothetical protein